MRHCPKFYSFYDFAINKQQKRSQQEERNKARELTLRDAEMAAKMQADIEKENIEKALLEQQKQLESGNIIYLMYYRHMKLYESCIWMVKLKQS